MKIQDILVPTDFSENSLTALDFALNLVEPGGEIYLLHVIDTDFVAHLIASGFGETELAIEKLRATAEQRLGEMISSGGRTDIRMESMVVVGKPFAEILRVADDLDFKLIVIGTRGQRGSSIEELLFGSTAEKVLRATPVPVICVPPGWKA